MSQTETVMVFALGFCSALLVVLLFGRSFWGAIGQWGSWKNKRGTPAAILDLQAERDSLKAERAMLMKRVETGSTDLKMRMAEQMAEVARNRNRVLDLNASLKASQAEVDVLKAANTGLVANIGTLKTQIEDNVRAINEAWSKASDSSVETQSEKKAYAKLQVEMAEKRQQISNFEAEVQALREIIAMFVPSHAGDDSAERLKKLAHKSVGMTSGYAEAPFALSAAANIEADGLPAAISIVPAAAVGVTQPANDERPDAPVPATASGDQGATALPEESEDMAKGITNVLSLAERVRELQKSKA
jgi:cell division protein FtsB